LAAKFIRNLDAWDSETRACEHGSQEDLAELQFWWGFLIWKLDFKSVGRLLMLMLNVMDKD